MEGSVVIHLYNRNHGLIYEAPGPEVTVVSVDSALLPRLLSFLALIFLALGVLIFFIYFLPAERKVTSQPQIITMPVNVNPTYQPKLDPSLPADNRLKIPSIGVDGEINEATLDNYESALKKGVWRVSDFGTPTAMGRPIILAAHRFGYLSWSNLFRRKSSFYNLPKLAAGNIVEIDWGQRRYVYEIYKEDKGTQITDYSADLILYTCEFLNSDVRIFKYGRLLEI